MNHKCQSDYKCSNHGVNVILCCKPKRRGENKNTTSGSDGLNQNDNVNIEQNNAKIDQSQAGNKMKNVALLTEIITVVDDKGDHHKVLALFDQGATQSAICNEKADIFYGKKPLNLTFNVNNLAAGKVIKRGNHRTVKILTKEGGQELVDCFGIENLRQKYQDQSFPAPDAWCKKYNLKKTPKNDSGWCSFVIGYSHPFLFPEQLEMEGGTVLFRSRITGRLLLAGHCLESKTNNLHLNKMSFNLLNQSDISTDSIEASRLIKCENCLTTVSKCMDCLKPHLPESKMQKTLTKMINENIEYNEQKQF